MKRKMMTAFMLVVAFSLPVSICQSKTMASKAGLEKTVNTFFGFVKENNADKIKTYYTADYTFTGPDGKMMGAEERLKMLKAGTGPSVVSSSDITVRTYGSAGIATGMVMTKNESGATQQSRFIQFWVWQGGRWRLAASQVTPIA